MLDGWTRQIAFVKDPDPLAPNYFVLCDTLREPAPATWRLWLASSQVTIQPQGATASGREDVDTDVWFLLPAGVEFKTEEKSRRAGSGLRPDGVQDAITTTQTGLIATNKDALVFAVVLYPRLKTENPPTCTPLADGKAVKIVSAAGTDYVFLSAQPFTFNEGDLAFEGTCGSIQQRGNRIFLSLGAAGSLSVNGKALTSECPAEREW